MTNGRAANGTFQAGMRRTFTIDGETAWRQWTGPALARWLDIARAPRLEEGQRIVRGGVEIRAIRVREPEHLRLRLMKPDWPAPRTAQLRVLPSARGTTVALHIEGLPDAATRAAYLERWGAAFGASEESVRGGLRKISSPSAASGR